MIVRPEQMEKFASADSPQFEANAVLHVQENFPKHAGFLGENGVKDLVQYGRKQAAGYGFLSSAHVTLYIDLMLLLGRGFDSDPQLPWAASALTGKKSKPDEKAEVLHQRAMDYLDLVSGPANEFIDAAQSRLLQEPLEIPSAPAAFMKELTSRLKKVFPEKALYLGDDGLGELIRAAAAASGKYELSKPQGVMLFAGMMFLLGSSFDSDPLFGWATTILKDKRNASSDERIQHLHAAGISYLKQWCA